MKIIVGLGNPGEKYKITRHNAGFLIIDKIVEGLGLKWQLSKKFNAAFCKDGNTIYLKPLTFMNNSGIAVRSVLAYYNLLPKKLIIFKEKNSDLSDCLTVIHDDVDIELGKYKNSTDSRSAGHNGVQSIINHLKTKNFNRVRIGVKTGKLGIIPRVKFVLQRFNKEELEEMNKLDILVD